MSWASRLLASNSRSGDTTLSPAATPSPSPSPSRSPQQQPHTPPSVLRAPAHISDNLLDQTYSIPALHRTPGKAGKTSRAAGHGRSISHPFPSLFLRGKKKSTEGAGLAPGFDSTDDDSPTSYAAPPSIGQLLRSGAAKAATAAAHTPFVTGKDDGEELTTGRCMTCDSCVRWPRDLVVFRCTVCLTINDLKPVKLEARRSDGHRAVVMPNPTASWPVEPNGSWKRNLHEPILTGRAVMPISLPKTRTIIEKCLAEYLQDCLRQCNSSIAASLVEGREKRLSTDARQSSLTPVTKLAKLHENTPESPSLVRDDHRQETVSLSTPISECQGMRKDHTSPRQDLQPASVHGSNDKRHLDFKQDLGSNPRGRLAKNIFRPLEDYLVTCLGTVECVNASFSTRRPGTALRAASEGMPASRASLPSAPACSEDELSEMDAKTLLLGDFAENGSWWTGSNAGTPRQERHKSRTSSHSGVDMTTLKSPCIDWAAVDDWYAMVLAPGRAWRQKLQEVLAISDAASTSAPNEQDIEDHIMAAEIHTQRVLLKATESLLKRPGRPLKQPSELRFLFILLENPLLSHSVPVPGTGTHSRTMSTSRPQSSPRYLGSSTPSKTLKTPHGSLSPSKGNAGQHSVIIKRILGLLSNAPNDCHHYIVSWSARLTESRFQRLVDLVGSFVTYRLTRQHGKRRETEPDVTAGLVPTTAGPGRTSSAALHAALGVTSHQVKKPNSHAVVYGDDWQVKAGARVMALLFAANNSNANGRRREPQPPRTTEQRPSAGLVAREKARLHGQIIPTSDFYNTMLDCSDLVSDFEAWESRRGKFAFCQYPFFLSIWAKIKILEHDARRQMEIKAREAFFDSIMTKRSYNQYLVLKIRRDCLVEDSLKGISESVGTGSEEIKKGLRIEFAGEEGVDAGGLRKEWFLLLVRDVFNPEHGTNLFPILILRALTNVAGMFTYDEDSRCCYFDANTLETTDQFFLVGVVLGLAIYNSTILDVALPPFAFRKLLAARPANPPNGHAKPTMVYTVDDLAEYQPSLANGLRRLLDFEGDVETTFCRDFVADVDRYGQVVQVPLCPGGETRAVTNANRREFVDLYVRYLLDTAVVRQFEPFKRGFFTVCGGNALSLFRPEEIELLICGSDEPLDIPSLRAVSTNENWKVPSPEETEPIIRWFWESFMAAPPEDQRKLLSFITGSDRIPGMGAASLVIKIVCLGEDSPRFPIARTCFNQIGLWRYRSRQKLESMLWRAVHESEGFGLK